MRLGYLSARIRALNHQLTYYTLTDQDRQMVAYSLAEILVERFIYLNSGGSGQFGAPSEPTLYVPLTCNASNHLPWS